MATIAILEALLFRSGALMVRSWYLQIINGDSIPRVIITRRKRAIWALLDWGEDKQWDSDDLWLLGCYRCLRLIFDRNEGCKVAGHSLIAGSIAIFKMGSIMRIGKLVKMRTHCGYHWIRYVCFSHEDWYHSHWHCASSIEHIERPSTFQVISGRQNNGQVGNCSCCSIST